MNRKYLSGKFISGWTFQLKLLSYDNEHSYKCHMSEINLGNI